MSNKNISQVIKLLKREVKELPDPSVTLVGKKWKDPFKVLISCILSLRTKDETTLPASIRLFKIAGNVKDMLKLSQSKIEKTIFPVGFYKTKAKNILGIAKRLIDEFECKVPDDLDVLLTFKGVGRKTANLVLTEGFGKLGICVDTHVHRISNRFGYVKTKTPEKTEGVLRNCLPKKHWIGYNALLVLWGQNVCRPVSPICSKCTLSKMCFKAGVDVSR
ncbi:MAG: endonuclease III [Candidatus Zapsychrus exili]|nr:endonuclease III [Candidatus Zapsychrus exili]